MPTPVSALIHAATMVKSCRWLMWVNQLWYRYILEQPYIKFIDILSFLNKMDNKILCSKINNILFALEGVNQQETLLESNKLSDKNSDASWVSKGSSETTCDITYDFSEYSYLIPKQKKK